MTDDKNLLMHVCCGVCSGYPIKSLKEVGYNIIAYFYNPNIDSQEEFNRRLEAQQKICDYFDTKLIVEPYNPQEYLEYVKGYENEPEHGKRCIKCFELRLAKTFDKARELGINKITTSMTISPHKNFKLLSEIGQKLETDIKYLAIDFKKKDGFLKTNQISKELGLYRQNYCGCSFAKLN